MTEVKKTLIALQKKFSPKAESSPIVLFMLHKDKDNQEIFLSCKAKASGVPHKVPPYNPYKELNGILSYQKARDYLDYLDIYNYRIVNLVILSSLIALIKEWKASYISFVIVEVA